MATKQSTQVARGDPARAVHAGVNAVVGNYNANSATLSASDTIEMVRIPHGAIILEIVVGGTAPVSGAIQLQIGDGGSDDRFGEASLSATAALVRLTKSSGLGYTYSMSDDADQRWDTIDLTVAAASTATTTCSFVMTVTYYMKPA